MQDQKLIGNWLMKRKNQRFVIIKMTLQTEKNMVNYINSKQNFWVAHETPRFTNYTTEEISSLCGTFIDDDYTDILKK